jgi:hypothetical protein
MQEQSAATSDCFIQHFKCWCEHSSDAQESLSLTLASKGSEGSYGLANSLAVRTNCRPTLTDKSRGWRLLAHRSSQDVTTLFHPSLRVCDHAVRCFMNGIRVTDLSKSIKSANAVQKENEIPKGQIVWEILQDKYAELSTIYCHLQLLKLTFAHNHSYRKSIKQVSWIKLPWAYT